MLVGQEQRISLKHERQKPSTECYNVLSPLFDEIEYNTPLESELNVLLPNVVRCCLSLLYNQIKKSFFGSISKLIKYFKCYIVLCPFEQQKRKYSEV